MNWFMWTLIGLQILGMLITAGQVGSPKKPTTPRQAVISVVVNSAIVVGLLWTGGVL